jgi:hypothetical protein
MKQRCGGRTALHHARVPCPNDTLTVRRRISMDCIVANCRYARESIVIERLILGAFLVLPLLIVAFLLSDGLWQERRRHPPNRRLRRIDWRHPLRSLLHRQ